MVCPKERDLTRIFREPHDFKIQLHEDLPTYFNPCEFGDFHVINGYKFLSVFTSDLLSKHIVNDKSSIEGITKTRGVLFLKCEDVQNVDVSQPLRIDGRLYTIEDISKIGNVIWRIVVVGNEG